MMYQGCDVWLNTPRRPLEACGTSGMKAAVNGALNCSIADGWWDECADGLNGWVITSADEDPDPARRDLREGLNLFSILEGDVVPTFYDGAPPSRWIARMKHAWATLGPFVTASRMVKDYTTGLYEPAAAQSDRFIANRAEVASSVADWKANVARQWAAVRITAFEAEHGKASADVHLGVLGTITGTDGAQLIASIIPVQGRHAAVLAGFAGKKGLGDILDNEAEPLDTKTYPA
jgi:starch phosphorylase